MVHTYTNIIYVYFMYNFIEDTTQTDKNTTEQQRDGKFILPNL